MSKYLSNGSLVTIKILTWDDFVVMEIVDTGIGIVFNRAA
jgi:signal transduction histidine kinase